MPAIRLFAVLLFMGFALLRAQQSPAKTTTISEKAAGFQKMDGYFPLYWDARAGKLWLEVSRFDEEFLYLDSLPAGVGSNDVGLDRGQTGEPRIVRFQRIGPKVLLTQSNYRFRSLSRDADERRTVEESFAQSVLHGFTVEAEEGNRVLVDATAFYVRDAHQIADTLRRTGQGTYRLDAARSAVYLDRTRNFPQNTEVEATLTFAGDQPGAYVRDVTPSPDSITVREHHSFVALPDNEYQPRAFNPNSGSFAISFMEFATPFDQPVQQRYLSRHRLRKKDPRAAVSEPVRPIRYYLDRGAPEPIRTALLEGARWWNQAFEAAGYRNAFQVELLPEGADPMDIRYNVINWVHRATRGWSYGASIEDPRTGEIIKGQVTLGSLRARQDYLIAEGLLAPYEPGKPVPAALREMVLARLRQLAAHEVGHTLGFAHNYIASTRGRSSVMDYPHPLIKLTTDGVPDLSEAYATGIGEWDKVSVAYAYQDFPPGTDDAKALADILHKAHQRSLAFLTDADARPQGSAHPQVHLWDNGENSVAELQRMMQVRARALARFGENAVRPGHPMSSLEDVLVPLYLSHRYQAEAAAKVVAGLNYTYALRGDGQVVTAPVPPAEQRAALQALLATIQPDALLLPERILSLIPPRAFGFARTRETFPNRTGITFDPLSAAESAADLSLMLLLHPERAGRLVEYGARQANGLGLGEVVDAVLTATWRAKRQPGLAAEVQRRVNHVALVRLLGLSADERAAPQARAVALQKLHELQEYAERQSMATTDVAERAHLRYAVREIKRYEADPKGFVIPRLAEAPPGQPIGCEE